MKITIEHYDKSISVEMPDDILIGEVAETLKGILITCGFTTETVLEIFAEEYQY